MGGDPDRTTGCFQRGAAAFTRNPNSGVRTIWFVRQSKMTENQERVYSKSMRVQCLQQTVEISVAVIWRSAIQTSGGFYRANIESFSETEPSSSLMFQRHFGTLGFRLEYTNLLLKLTLFSFYVYFLVLCIFLLAPHWERSLRSGLVHLCYCSLMKKWPFRCTCVCACVLLLLLFCLLSQISRLKNKQTWGLIKRWRTAM